MTEQAQIGTSNSYAARINARRLILGPKDDLMAISPMKHTWHNAVWDMMMANDWKQTDIALNNDKQDYIHKLTDGERFMYDKALAFLSNLDGIQFNNLVHNIGHHITSPEVSMLIARQAYEEALHVKSYAAMIEAVSLDPMLVYMTFERDELLAAKNKYILAESRALNGEFTPRKFALALISNILLEGVFFFSGFLAFYLLGRNGKMLGSTDMIRYIQRDEERSHLELFIHMLQTMQQEHPEVFDVEFWAAAERLFRAAVELEISWGKHIISGGVLGVTPAIIEDYIKSLANKRAASIGMPAPYPGVVDPLPWVAKFSDPNGVESNYFETKVTSYDNSGAGALDWDE